MTEYVSFLLNKNRLRNKFGMTQHCTVNGSCFRALGRQIESSICASADVPDRATHDRFGTLGRFKVRADRQHAALPVLNEYDGRRANHSVLLSFIDSVFTAEKSQWFIRR